MIHEPQLNENVEIRIYGFLPKEKNAFTVLLKTLKQIYQHSVDILRIEMITAKKLLIFRREPTKNYEMFENYFRQEQESLFAVHYYINTLKEL